LPSTRAFLAKFEARLRAVARAKACADADDETYVLCRSGQRIAKDRTIRAKHEAMLTDIQKLAQRVAKKPLVKPERINQAVGRLRERDPGVARYHPFSCDEKTATLTPRSMPTNLVPPNAQRLLSAQD
jgi:hypothetical protein